MHRKSTGCKKGMGDGADRSIFRRASFCFFLIGLILGIIGVYTLGGDKGPLPMLCKCRCGETLEPNNTSAPSADGGFSIADALSYIDFKRETP